MKRVRWPWRSKVQLRRTDAGCNKFIVVNLANPVALVSCQNLLKSEVESWDTFLDRFVFCSLESLLAFHLLCDYLPVQLTASVPLMSIEWAYHDSDSIVSAWSRLDGSKAHALCKMRMSTKHRQIPSNKHPGDVDEDTALDLDWPMYLFSLCQFFSTTNVLHHASSWTAFSVMMCVFLAWSSDFEAGAGPQRRRKRVVICDKISNQIQTVSARRLSGWFRLKGCPTSSFSCTQLQRQSGAPQSL